ncbi:MAG: class I adenylate-forming enzyme family protein [bacterium]|nr:class I adenylate-forming enzyme family protein [bacterium]
MKAIVPIKSLHGHIAALAKTQPKKKAFLACDDMGKVVDETSYEELARKIEAAAAYLAELGLTKGDRVALAFKNSPELLILSWAAWSAGIVTVPMDTKRDTGEQYQYKLKLNKAKVLIAQAGALKNIEPKYLEGFEVVEFEGLPADFKKTEWKHGLIHPALVLFTSGTTGHPKGAKLSLENLIVNADGIRHWLKITEKDTFLVNLPLHHINSTTFCLATLLAGGTIAIPPNYSNSHFWQQVAKTGATITSIVQSILFDQVGRESEYNEFKPHIKLNRIQIGSAPVIAQTVQEFMRKFDIPLYQGYGHTETALRVTGVSMDLSESLYKRLVEENSIGTAMPWADVQIMGEEGKILGEEQEGELAVKGPAVMEGYVGEEPAFRNGYFLTGDVGLYRIIGGKRYFFLKGRKKEIIIKGGINISPVAVENHLKKISKDIEQVYAVSVADERYGEEIGAVIVWKQGIDIARAKRRLKCTLLFGTPFISLYETPKYLTSLTLEELPMTSTGKVQRTVLKDSLPYERFESIYGLVKTPEYRFTALHRYSRWVPASYKLYNLCWAPLVAEKLEYEKNIPKQLIILAARPDDSLAGQIALIRTDLSSEELLHTTYAQLLAPEISNPQGKRIVCISICSADYRPKGIPTASNIPTQEEVQKYLPLDPVYKFHQKPKGGGAGAELVGLIPNGRPEDKSSLGYNMLLKYPPPDEKITTTEGAPVSNQLIETVMVMACDAGITDVYAYSRPGGLAAYMAKEA